MLQKKYHLPKRVLRLIAIGFVCLGAGIVIGQSAQQRSANVLLNKIDTINSIPHEYGRLVTVERSRDGTVMYFEAQDGTIRLVTVIYGIDYGSLTFRAVTVPRS